MRQQGGRTDDPVVDPVILQHAVQPEAVPAGLVAGQHRYRRIRAVLRAGAGLFQVRDQLGAVAGRHLLPADLLATEPHQRQTEPSGYRTDSNSAPVCV